MAWSCPGAGPRRARASRSTPAARDPAATGSGTPQLTVLFCDLVDRPRWRGTWTRKTCARCAGLPSDLCRVIHLLTAILLSTSGWHAGLFWLSPGARRRPPSGPSGRARMRQAMDPLNTRLTLPPGDRLAVRLGIHTGWWWSGGGGRRPAGIPGARRRLPTSRRLQGLAAPNTLVISSATWQLLSGFFACQALGPMRLHGRTQRWRSIRCWR